MAREAEPPGAAPAPENWANLGRVGSFRAVESGVIGGFERGAIEVRAVSPGVIRIRCSEGPFRPRRSWSVVRDHLPPADPDVAVGAHEARLTMPGVDLAVGGDGRVTFRGTGSKPFELELDPVRFRTASLAETGILAAAGDELPASSRRMFSARLGLDAAEVVYGLGERTGDIDRRNRQLTNWNIDDTRFGHGRSHDNLYQSHPSLMAIRPGRAWGLFLNVSFFSRFDVGYRDHEALGIEGLGGELDLYWLAGPTPTAVVEQLTRLTGRPALPPLWALGFHHSRWGYRTEREFRELAREFRERNLPLDALHFDIDYMRGYRDFTWDPDRFPDPKRLLDDLGEMGIRGVTILDPGVKFDIDERYPVARDGLMSRVFIEEEEGLPLVGYCWPDAALFPDFVDPRVRRWWSDQLVASHIAPGVAGIWTDMNEPSVFSEPFSKGPSQQAPIPLGTRHGPKDERVDHAEVRNLYGLLMARATHEGLARHRPEERPWVLTRSGFTGVQTWAASWMGDNSSWWEHLELSLPQLLSMGISGSPFVGVDIGGFFEHCSGELFARWMEAGTFYPFMRVHAERHTRSQEPWAFGPDVERVARRSLRLRYRLLPYLYTLSHEAHLNGTPIMRPMIFAYPDVREFLTVQDQFMLGPSLLVAPVIVPRQARRTVLLPPGGWRDFWTGRALPSHPERVTPLVVEAPLGQPPVFVPEGAVLPLGNVRASTQEPLSEITFVICPGRSASFTLWEDDGVSDAYRTGAEAWTSVSAHRRDDAWQVELAPRRGAYEPARRSLQMQVHVPEPSAVTLDAAETPWFYDDALQAAIIRFEDDGAGHEIVLSARA